MEENKIRTISWSAPSHTHALRSTDWMWGIGLLALVGAGFTFYFHNYVFGIFILISGVAIIMLYSQPSVEINFEINNEGVKVGNSLYLYKKPKWLCGERYTTRNTTDRNKRLLSTCNNYPLAGK
jgi:hypothetical protein